jgi:hypothetical protein
MACAGVAGNKALTKNATGTSKKRTVFTMPRSFSLEGGKNG